jgi:hypothetical protein
VNPGEFLSDFFRYSSGAVYICSLANERGAGKTAAAAGRKWDRIDELVLQKWSKPGRGSYFCPNTVMAGQATRSKETICEITSLFVDIDHDKVDMAPDAILHVLETLKYPPSKIVNSGHGHHCYWLFNEALPVSPELVLQAEMGLRQLARVLGGDPATCEIARLLRLPGSSNTKTGDSIPVRVISNSSRRYELDDLCPWVAETRVLIPLKGESPGSNPFLNVHLPGGGPAVDIEQRLAAMTYQGSGDSSVHQTQVSTTAALLSRGRSIDEVVTTVLAETRRAAGTDGARWDWDREERDIRAMCASWQRKKLNGHAIPTGALPLQWAGDMPAAPMQWLVKGLVPQCGVGLISGQTGTYKTFLALELAGCLATGTSFADQRIMRKCATLLLPAEGVGSIPGRLRALATKYGGKDLPIAAPRGVSAPKLLEAGTAETLIATIQSADMISQERYGLPTGLVLIDTVMASAGFQKSGDENDSSVNARLMGVLNDVAAATGTMIMGVDHFGKEVETGTRGSSAKEGAADIVLALLGKKDVTGTVENPQMAARKVRDGEGGRVFPFSVRSAPSGAIAEDGTPENSLVIEWGAVSEIGLPAAKPSAQGDKYATRIRKLMLTLAASAGTNIQTPEGRTVRAVPYDTLREEFRRRYLGDGHERMAWKRTIEGAEARGAVEGTEINGTRWLWLAT